jgi:uncharacterized protein
MKMSRRNFFKAMGLAVAGTTLTATSGVGYAKNIEPGQLTIESVQLPLHKLKPALEGFKIVHMSDFHLHPYTQIEFIRQAVAQANALKPDLVVLTGDYVQEGADSIFELAPALAALEARYGVFTSLGNHDLWTDKATVQLGLKEARLPLLLNQGVSLGVGNATLYLAGLDDGWSGQPDLTAAMANYPGGDTPAILLAHEPDLADTFAQDERIGLQLSGHSHGGQVRLPGLGAPILPPLGKKYDQGLYRVGQMWLYTTRGVGLGPVPVRFNCPPEITEITLTRRG